MKMSRKHSVKIGEISKLVNGHAFNPKDWNGRGLPIVRIQNLNDESKPYNYSDKVVPVKHIIDSGDVLLSWSGTPGTSFGCFIWNRGKALLNQHIFKVLVDNSRMDDSFFMNAVNSRLDEMISKAHGGVGLRHITKKKLEAIRIPCPEIQEQRLIVIKIKELLERVEEIKSLQKQSLKEARYLFSNRCSELFNQNWPEKQLEQLLVGGLLNGVFKKRKDFGNGTLLANVKDLYADQTINVKKLERVKVTGSEIKKYQVQPGDVLVNRSSLKREGLGRSCMFLECEEPVVFECHVMRVRLNQGILKPYLLAAFMNSPIGLSRILQKAKTATMTTWNQQDLKSMMIPVPPISQQKKMVDKLFKFKGTADSMRNELIKATEESRLITETIFRKAFA